MSTFGRRSVVTENSRRYMKQKEEEFEDRRTQRSISVVASASRMSPKTLKKKLGMYPPPSPLASPSPSRANARHFMTLPPADRAAIYNALNSLPLSSFPYLIDMKTKIHHYSPQEVAEELCIMDAELLRKIRPEELEHGAWMKNDKKHKLSPNVLAMVHASNKLAMLVPSEILAETTPQEMAKVISSFIKIASKCHLLYNFNSLKAVLAGLQCTPIFRLKRAWKEVPAKKRKKYEMLTKLMSEEFNYRDYRLKLGETLTNNIPCVPFLGVLLTTIVQQDSAHSHRSKRTGCKYSGVEDYTIIEAITVRNRLEKLRKRSSVKHCVSMLGPPTQTKANLVSGGTREILHAGQESNGNKYAYVPTQVPAFILEESKRLSLPASGCDFSVHPDADTGSDTVQSELTSTHPPSSPGRRHTSEMKSSPLSSHTSGISKSPSPAGNLKQGQKSDSSRKRSSGLDPSSEKRSSLPSTHSRNNARSSTLDRISGEHSRLESKLTLSDISLDFDTNCDATPTLIAKGLATDLDMAYVQFSHALTFNNTSDDVLKPQRPGSGSEKRRRNGVSSPCDGSSRSNVKVNRHAHDTGVSSPCDGSSRRSKVNRHAHDTGVSSPCEGSSRRSVKVNRHAHDTGVSSPCDGSSRRSVKVNRHAHDTGVSSPCDGSSRRSVKVNRHAHETGVSVTDAPNTRIAAASYTRDSALDESNSIPGHIRDDGIDEGDSNYVAVHSRDIKCANATSDKVVGTDNDSLPTSVANPNGNNGPSKPVKIGRCASDQEVNLSAPSSSASIHNSCSAECIADIMKMELYDLTNEVPLGPLDKHIIKTSVFNTVSASSMSSDEGIGVSDYEERGSSCTTSPELATAPSALSLMAFVGLSRVQSSPNNYDIDGHVNTLKRSSPTVNRHAWNPDKPLFWYELEKYQNKQDIEVQEDEEEDDEIEEEPEIGPQRRRSRRRASQVLLVAQASTEKELWNWSNLLFRYQMSSLGCSNPLTSQDELRKLIMESPRNSEAHNYKLSYEREPH